MTAKRILPPLKQRKFSKQDIKAFLKTDRAILMICISIAFVFWLMTKLSYSYKDTVLIDLEYQPPANKVFTTPPPNQLEVDIEGKGWDLLGIAFSSEKRVITIPIEESEPKIISALALNNKVMKFVPRVEVLNIYPENIYLQTEDVATKKIPVVLKHQIKLKPLRQLKDSIRITPSHVQVTGPASIVKEMQVWYTDFLVPKKQIDKSFNVDVLLKEHPNRSINFSTNKINCSVMVEEVTEKQLEIPIQILNAPDSLLLVILPKKIKLSCRVGLSNYASLTADDFVAIVDLGNENFFEKSAIRVLLKERPSYVSQIQYSPKNVDYIVRSK